MYLFARGNPLSYIDPMGLCGDPSSQKELEKELGIERGVGKGGNEGGILTEEETARLKESYKQFADEMRETGVEYAKVLTTAAVTIGLSFVPGEEIAFAVVAKSMGWVVRGGKLLTATGEVVTAVEAEGALVSARKLATTEAKAATKEEGGGIIAWARRKLGFGRKAKAAAPNKTVIGKVKDLDNLAEGESTLLERLPDQGTPKANWRQNSSVLRQEIRKGNPIRDASLNPDGTLKNYPGSFLEAERNLLREQGWTFDSSTVLWSPTQ